MNHVVEYRRHSGAGADLVRNEIRQAHFQKWLLADAGDTFFILCQHDSLELRKSDIRKAIVKLDTWNCAVLFVSFFDIPL